MNRIVLQITATAISAAALVGCQGNTYQPGASETGLAAYAAKAAYPYNVKAELGVHLFCDAAQDGTLTIFNAGEEPINDFEIWVGQTFTLHVPKLGGHDKIMIAPNTLYNNTGSNMGGAPPSSIKMVQIFADGKLWDVQGPIIPHN